MIRGRGAERRRELGTARGAQLVRMQLDAEPGSPGRLENRSRLLDGVDARLAEDVREARQSLAGDRRQRLGEQEADGVAARAWGGSVLEWNLVRAEPRRHEPKREHLAEPSDRAQRLQLVLEGEPVAGLHLDGRRAVRRERAKARQRERDELVLAPLAKVAHGGVDSPAATGDRHVVEPGRTQLLLLVTRPPEDGVGMRVDEARRQDAAAAVDALRTRMRALDAVAGPDRRDAPAIDDDRGGGDDLQLPHIVPSPSARGAGAGHALSRAGEE